MTRPVLSRRRRLSLATLLGTALAAAALTLTATVPATAAATAPPIVAPGTPNSTDITLQPAGKAGGPVAQAVVTVCALTAYSPSALKTEKSIFAQAATQCNGAYLSYQTVCVRLVGLANYGNTGKSTKWFCGNQTSNVNTNKAISVACSQATDSYFETQGKVNGEAETGQAFSASVTSGAVPRSSLCS